MEEDERSINKLPYLPKVVRLLPDEFKLYCYTQVDFEQHEQEYMLFEPKVNYIKLERPFSYKLSSTNTLRAVAANLLYLNPNLDKERFSAYLTYIVDHHFSHSFSEKTIEQVVVWCLQLKKKNKLNPNGKLRRIVFKPGNTLTTKEKQAISGRLNGVGAKLDTDTINDCLEDLQNNPEPITIIQVANSLECHESTVRRVLKQNNELRQFLKEINETIANARDIKKYRVAVLKLHSGGTKISGYAIRKETKFSSKRLKEIEGMEKLD